MLQTSIVSIKLQAKEEFVIKAPVLPLGNMENGPSVQSLVVPENEAKWEFAQETANEAPNAINLIV